MGKRDAPEPFGTGVVDARVLGELLATPQDHRVAACLEEDRHFDFLPAPPEPFIELACAVNVSDAQGHQARPLFHEFS
ncbi:MAG TPA: hypothetical protein VHF25_10070 [Nitriliruptorales bacterium]|nr:hypothetical protein [Nitriliruptorales bacterium]